jgi:hypothetical protein
MVARTGFLYDLTWIFVVAARDELGVSKLVGPGPLSEVDAGNSFRFQPNAAFHFLGR